MASYSNHSTFEPDVYLFYHHDGLFDAFVGVTLILFAAFIFVDLPWLIAIWAATLLPIWQSVKKTVTAPRLRDADFTLVESVERRSAQVRIVLLIGVVVLALLGAMVLWLMVSASAPSWLIEGLEGRLPLILGLFVVLSLGLVGVLLGIVRFYLYTVLTAIVVFAGYLLHAPVPLIVAIDGGIIAIGGGVVLIRFLRTHPIQNG